jgi:hypothetical protein
MIESYLMVKMTGEMTVKADWLEDGKAEGWWGSL